MVGYCINFSIFYGLETDLQPNLFFMNITRSCEQTLITKEEICDWICKNQPNCHIATLATFSHCPDIPNYEAIDGAFTGSLLPTL